MFNQQSYSSDSSEVEPGMKLIIVSNRLPVIMNQDEDGRWNVEPSSGGLVTAMTPVLKRRGGLWIGWADSEEAEEEELDVAFERLSRRTGYEVASVVLTPEEYDLYYLGFSNEVLWPLFHDLQSRANFDPEYWQAYREVNRKFAKAVSAHTTEDDVVWVHDYHLMLVAQEMRRIGMKGQIEFFLHTPFPPVDIFAKLPWRRDILRSLLLYDAVGFQTLRDLENYLQCVHHFVPDAEVAGNGRVRTIKLGDHLGQVGAFPISIDVDHFEDLARSEEVRRERDALAVRFEGRHVILGVDRLDYTKGIPHRLRAYRHALATHPELHDRITLIQQIVPSRDDIPEYAHLKNEVDQLVGEINGEFASPGWVPVQYLFRGLPQEELIALYRSADTMLVTPLKDGMNLVAKEYCAVNLDEDGCLILSEFAGAFPQMRNGALGVNPYDVEETARTIVQAFNMSDEERTRRMKLMRTNIRDEDIFWWVDSFLKAAEKEFVDVPSR